MTVLGFCIGNADDHRWMARLLEVWERRGETLSDVIRRNMNRIDPVLTPPVDLLLILMDNE